MLRLAAAFATTFIATTVIAQEDHDAKVDALYAALQLPEMMEIMREEGLEYGATIGADLIPGGATPDWDAAVSAIYDPVVMGEELRGAMGETLEGEDIDAMIEFFTSDPGQGIIDLEVSARRALLDEAVDEAAKESAAIAMADNTERFQLVEEFVEANDLIEANVVGALNSSYAFYLGLIDGGAMPAGMTPEVALQEVWTQEPDIRTNTTEWVYSFLLMAYQPVEEADLQAYIAFSRSEAGQAMNDALFQSFAGMFDDISRALGLASSRFMLSQEL